MGIQREDTSGAGNMHKSLRVRIYPNGKQRALIAQTFGATRYVYNNVLACSINEYAYTKRTFNVYKYMKMLPKWKEGLPWLSEVDAVALQQSLRDLDSAYRNFFRDPGKTGFPKFKSKRACKKRYRTHNVKVMDQKHLQIPKLGRTKARVSRDMDGRILSATIELAPSGRYHAVLLVDDGLPEPDVRMPSDNTEVTGVDIGIHDLIVTSDGTRFPNLKALKRHEGRLRREQRRLSRKKKGGANYRKQKHRLAKIHEKVANTRRDAIHKATSSVIHDSQGVAAEDLRTGNLLKNNRLAGAISDASFSEILRQLEYKARWNGIPFARIGTYYPSSKLCHACGWHNDSLKLSERTWTCGRCHTSLDRDVNAAMNIRDEGHRVLNTVGHTGINASGVAVRPRGR